MADENTGQQQTPTPPPEGRGSVMHAIHEGAQLFEATGRWRRRLGHSPSLRQSRQRRRHPFRAA
jgi:hypothetical protein